MDVALPLTGLFGKTVQIEGRPSVTADEAYIRESIINPQAQLVAGFQPIMPTFKGQLTEEQILHLVAYIKSLGPSRKPQAQQLKPGPNASPSAAVKAKCVVKQSASPGRKK